MPRLIIRLAKACRIEWKLTASIADADVARRQPAAGRNVTFTGATSPRTRG